MAKKKFHFTRRMVRVLYALVLTACTVFILLDAFVIPKNIVSANVSTSDPTVYENGTVTDTSYKDDAISIEITTERVHSTTVYIADVQISDAKYLKAGLAGGSFGQNLTETTSQIASDNNAIFAVNGDYYGFRSNGYVLRNGYLYRSSYSTSTEGEDLVIYSDGSMDVVSESDKTAQELIDAGATQIFSFGPGLVESGEVTVSEDQEVERAQVTNPRTAVGMIEPLHYKFVVSDGRTSESHGLSLLQLAQVMEDLGCTVAYNLDGGGSSTMWFNGKVLNNPTTYGDTIQERSLSDIVYIGE